MIALFARDLRLSVRAGGGALVGVLFFLTVVAVIPFGVGPDLKLLARIGPAMLWVGALLSCLLGLDRLFQGDRDDGSLDLMLMQETPMSLTVLVKCLAHWTGTALPLVVVSPLLALFMNMSPRATGAVAVTLLRRLARHHLHRRGGGGGRRHAAPGRPPRVDPGPAADRSGADLRRRRGLCRRRAGRRAFSAALPHSLRNHPVLCGDRTAGGVRRPPRRVGLRRPIAAGTTRG